jgi:nitroreductase
MDCLEAIRTRRSIRAFTQEQVPDEQLRKIIEAGMYAPSAGNQQPWQFVVITDKNILKKVPDIHPYATMVPEVSVAILVCGDTSLEKFKGYWVQDCSAAVQNMLLAAHSLGLGAVWTGIHPMQDRVGGFQKLCKLPDSIVPLALVPLGYPAQKPGTAQRFKEERIHSNTW